MRKNMTTFISTNDVVNGKNLTYRMTHEFLEEFVLLARVRKNEGGMYCPYKKINRQIPLPQQPYSPQEVRGELVSHVRSDFRFHIKNHPREMAYLLKNASPKRPVVVVNAHGFSFDESGKDWNISMDNKRYWAVEEALDYFEMAGASGCIMNVCNKNGYEIELKALPTLYPKRVTSSIHIISGTADMTFTHPEQIDSLTASERLEILLPFLEELCKHEERNIKHEVIREDTRKSYDRIVSLIRERV